MAQDATYRAELNYQNEITADVITVIFNGTTYTVPKDLDGDYGLTALMSSGSSTGNYPFCIARESGTNYVYVNVDVYENHNPFTIKIMEESVSTTPCFEKARGYWCEEGMVTLTEESVTTELQGSVAYGELSYSQPIDADGIKVTFDGVEYECPRLSDDTYGAPYDRSTNTFDWSEYPFSVFDNNLATPSAGTYAIKIEGVGEIATTTPCFEKAVKTVIPSSVGVPKKAYEPKVFNLTSEGTVTVPANGAATLSFPSTGTRFSQFAVIRRMDIPSNLLINDFSIGGSEVFVNVYNVTSSPITVTNAQLSLVDFVEVDATICVTAGTGCGGGK